MNRSILPAITRSFSLLAALALASGASGCAAQADASGDEPVGEAQQAETGIVVTCNMTDAQYDDGYAKCTPGASTDDLTDTTVYRMDPLQSIMVKVKCVHPSGSEANVGIYASAYTKGGDPTCYMLTCVGDGNGFMDCGFSCTNWSTDKHYMSIDSVTCED